MYNKYMKDLWNYLREQNRPVVLYGMGDGAEKVMSALSEYGISVSGVFASDGFVRPKRFCGFPVTDYKTAKENFPDMIVLLCFGTPLPDVIGNIRRIASETELYAPDVPVYGGPLFNREFYVANEENIKKVRSLLADDISVRCFDNLIKYKLTGDINLLFECETSPEEPYSSFLHLSEKENFLDLGAYRGDTVAEFIARAGKYNSITAVEPDRKTFSKLKAAVGDLYNITLINAAVSDKCGDTVFCMNGSRGSNAGTGEPVKAVTVDSLALSPTFIKFDVEGSELAAISGASETISKLKPKMKIAAYHRSEDIFRIPLCVTEFCPDYRVYLRHSPCLPGWDTDYYFI